MKQRPARRLRFEALESRRVLSGTVLFIRGGAGTGGFLEGGSDEQLADITNFSQSGGNHGWGELANALTDEGFALNQVIEGPGNGGNGSRVPLSSMNLDQYDVIVFGSNNAVYTTADVNAFEQYVRGGGAALFISDANFGSDWADASDSDQQFLDRIGMNVHQDQGTYVVGNQPGEILATSHPIFTGVGQFDGEGVSPFHIDETVLGVGITPLAGAEGNTRLNQPPFGNNNQGPSRQTNDGDFSAFAATWDAGRVVGHYDRNTFFNLNGAGTNINRFENRQYAINIFEWLASAPNLPGDYNSDCNVDVVDYAQWFSSFGSTTELAADGNRNGIIDAADYTIWQDNVGASCPATAVAVPADQIAVPMPAKIQSPEFDKSPFGQSTDITLLNYDPKQNGKSAPRVRDYWSWTSFAFPADRYPTLSH